MKIILRIFLGLVGLAVLTFGAAIFYLSASLGIIDVPWLSDTTNDVVGADSGPPTSFTSSGNRSPKQPASSGAEPSVPQPPVRDAREIEKVIDRDLSDDDRFEIVLSESEINQLLLSELSRDGRIRAVDVYVTPDLIEFNGELKGRIPIPFHGSLKFLLDAGKAVVDVQEIKLGVIPLAGFAKEGMNVLLNEVGDLNRALAETGQVEITEIELSTGSMRIAGRKRGAALAGMPNLSLDRPPIDPAILPKPRSRAVTEPAVKPLPGAWLYLSLGDSLAFGEGASSPNRNYAAGFRRYLEETYGVAMEFRNFGVSGESTNSFVRRAAPQIDRAIAEIRRVQTDGIPETNVHAVTLSLGANDIFPVLQNKYCTDDPEGEICTRELEAATSTLEQNMDVILGSLREAAGPDTLIMILTYYNPFDLGTGLAFENVSDSTLDRLNQRIIRVAQRHQAKVADANSIFVDLSPALTHILAGDIHPTDEGYAALLLAFENSYEEAGPFQ